jgi:ribosome-binding factor A
MMQDIKKQGLDHIWFAWAGYTKPEIGKGSYYRVQGPTLVIEYDNTQNNANHVHSVVRDLKNDFGGDLLLDHYQKGHSH